jgi:hypothetical protein
MTSDPGRGYRIHRAVRLAFQILAPIVWLLDAAPALAGDEAEKAMLAESLFREAAALMDASRYAEACPKLAESWKLAPEPGTRFYLGDCYEKIGLRASAWIAFTDAAELAKTRGKDEPAERARARADALLPLPKLTIIVPDEVATVTGLEIKRGVIPFGRATWNTALPVDPGRHVVTAAAPGKKPWSTVVEVEAPSGSVEIRVPPLQDLQKPAAPPIVVAPPLATARPPEAAPRRAPSPDGAGQRTVAIAVGAVGLAGVAAGAVFGGLAIAKANDAGAQCEGAPCNPTDVAEDNGAFTFADLSTGCFIAGAAAITGAAIIWLTAAPGEASKPSSISFLPAASAGGAGGLLRGTF